MELKETFQKVKKAASKTLGLLSDGHNLMKKVQAVADAIIAELLRS